MKGGGRSARLAVVAAAIGVAPLPSHRIETDPLSAEVVASTLRSETNGHVWRHVASLDCSNHVASASVRLCRLEGDDPLAGIRAEYNAAVIEWSNGETELLRGKGAGRWPTAEAVVADVLEIARIAAE